MCDHVIEFLRGGTMVALLMIGLHFLRFWRDAGDKLFGYFSGAFFLMALSQVAVVLLSETGELAYWLRLFAFILIIVAIVEKNIPTRDEPDK